MSLLHSFYCWGHVGVVLVSTVFFALFGTDSWKLLALAWAAVPVFNLVIFAVAPIYTLPGSGDDGMGFSGLFRSRIIWIFMLMVVCDGASEQDVEQWASTFAEKGLGVSKAVGDLAGPMAFAFMMGLSRIIFSRSSGKFDMERFLKFSCMLCMASYLCIVFIPSPVVGLLGCSVCGFAVGMLWPGTYSMASAALPGGGTVMFSLLALAGDVGCTSGPTLAGLVSSACGGNLRAGILAALAFPLLMLVGCCRGRLCCRERNKSRGD